MTVYGYLLLGIGVYAVVLAFLTRRHPDDDFWAEIHAEQDRRELADERKARNDLYGRSS